MPLGFVADMAVLALEIEADERLGYIMDTAAGTGNLAKNDQRRHMRELRRQARGRPRRRSEAADGQQADPQAPPMTAEALASVGVELVIVDG